MKETFRKNIENYSELAKEELKNDQLTDELRTVIDWHVRNASQKRATSEDTQGDIYRLQRDKQEIMAELKKEIKNIDDPNYKPEKTEDQYPVSLINGKFVVSNSRGEKMDITLGEILTDGEWGIDYYLDPNTMPRNIRKRYLIESNKRKIAGYLDQQISIDAINSRSTDYLKRRAYSAVLETLESGTKHKQGGFIAESMVRNYFKKLKYDQDLDIEIIDVDTEQDVEAKIDFIIRRSNHERGVDVQTINSSSYEDIGIQFTTNFSAVEHKQRRIDQIKSDVLEKEKIQDLILVAMPLSAVINDYDKWKIDGRRPGGPDKNIPILNRQFIFEKVLAGVFTSEEIKERWVKMGYEWVSERPSIGEHRQKDLSDPEQQLQEDHRQKMKKKFQSISEQWGFK